MARTPHMRYVRHRSFDRLRHSRRFRAFLEEQGTRLGMTAEEVFNDLMKAQGMTADQVAAMEAPDPETVPANTAVPTITGSTVTGQTLTAAPGTWTGNPAPTYTYQWKRDGANIAGATASTYVLVVADEGATITVTVTATNTAGNASATSAGVGPVTAT